MSPTDFLAAVESELQLQGVPFTRAELQTFLASAWPLVEDYDVARWAAAFLDTGVATSA